jgi:hypothetical protein
VNNPPNFHDGFLDGFLLSKSEARIFLRTAREEKFSLILHGVEALRANDLREGNIILSVTFLEPEQLDVSFVHEVYQYSDEHKKGFILEAWIRSAVQKNLKALEILPSYGCTALAIFSHHEFVEGHLAS